MSDRTDFITATRNEITAHLETLRKLIVLRKRYDAEYWGAGEANELVAADVTSSGEGASITIDQLHAAVGSIASIDKYIMKWGTPPLNQDHYTKLAYLSRLL